MGGLLLGQTRHFLILGSSNTAETLDTLLSTATAGAALQVTQDGTGVAVQGTSHTATGVAGQFTSFLGTGVAAIAGDGNGVALRATNQAPTTGAGAAIKAEGQSNDGLVAESWVRSAIVASATGAQPARRRARPERDGRCAQRARAGRTSRIVRTCSAAGLESTGANGVIAGTGTSAGAGVYATDRTADGTGFGLVSDGQVRGRWRSVR